MKYFIKFIIFILVSTCVLLTCSDEEKDKIKFSVKSTNGNFTGGAYKLNGGTTTVFDGVSLGSNVYEYELTLEDVDYLEVSVSKISEDQSVEIKIYRDGVKVKSDSIEPYEESGGTYLFLLELDYEYDEEDETSS